MLTNVHQQSQRGTLPRERQREILWNCPLARPIEVRCLQRQRLVASSKGRRLPNQSAALSNADRPRPHCYLSLFLTPARVRLSAVSSIITLLEPASANGACLACDG